MGTNKITFAIVALIAICVASFFAVKHITDGERINNPTIVVDQSGTAAPATQAPTFAPGTTVPTTVLPSFSIEEMPTVTTTATTTVAPSSEVTTAPTSETPTYTLPSSETTTTTAVTPVKPTDDPNIQQAAKSSDGFLGYLFDPDGNYYYTNNDPWQRYFGFNAAYDFGAQFVFMYFDTARIKFEYDNKDWMVEFWKGQYGGVFIGCEIGVYNKPKSRTVEHYDCASDEDALYMEMTFYRNGEEKLSREYAKYWWCTGFVPGKLVKYSDRSELGVKARITLKDKKMLKAFVKGLDTCQEFRFVNGDNYTVDGLDVFIDW